MISRVLLSVLILLVMLLAIMLITERYNTRALFIKSEQLQLQARELDVEWHHLQSERAELARNARISQLAKEELGLAPIQVGRTLYIPGRP